MAGRDDLLRCALWVSAGFNVGGALLGLFAAAYPDLPARWTSAPSPG